MIHHQLKMEHWRVTYIIAIMIQVERNRIDWPEVPNAQYIGATMKWCKQRYSSIDKYVMM
jgi:hypothetical protein